MTLWYSRAIGTRSTMDPPRLFPRTNPPPFLLPPNFLIWRRHRSPLRQLHVPQRAFASVHSSSIRRSLTRARARCNSGSPPLSPPNDPRWIPEEKTYSPLMTRLEHLLPPRGEELAGIVGIVSMRISGPTARLTASCGSSCAALHRRN